MGDVFLDLLEFYSKFANCVLMYHSHRKTIFAHVFSDFFEEHNINKVLNCSVRNLLFLTVALSVTLVKYLFPEWSSV